MLEHLFEEIRHQAQVVRISRKSQSCSPLVMALAVETDDNWMEANRDLDMDDPGSTRYSNSESRRMTSAKAARFAELDAHARRDSENARVIMR